MENSPLNTIFWLLVGFFAVVGIWGVLCYVPKLAITFSIFIALYCTIRAYIEYNEPDSKNDILDD